MLLFHAHSGQVLHGERESSSIKTLKPCQQPNICEPSLSPPSCDDDCSIVRLKQAARTPTCQRTASWLQAGKLDLTEVEGIADLLAAETSTQHRQAGSCYQCQVPLPGFSLEMWRSSDRGLQSCRHAMQDLLLQH